MDGKPVIQDLSGQPTIADLKHESKSENKSTDNVNVRSGVLLAHTHSQLEGWTSSSYITVFSSFPDNDSSSVNIKVKEVALCPGATLHPDPTGALPVGRGGIYKFRKHFQSPDVTRPHPQLRCYHHSAGRSEELPETYCLSISQNLYH